MEVSERNVVVTVQCKNDEIISIHALEIIDDIMTGIYFHACFGKDYDFTDNMYYLFDYEENDKTRSLKEFKNFIGNSNILTLSDYKKYICEIVEKGTNIKCDYKYKNLSEYTEKYKIDENDLDKGGIISCTILGRIICEKNK
jgi:hypothetical protein